ncbi:MAG: amidase family protein, partial [Anaplasma sp.]|nr:amidase family protein [Anaplasma sp.]
YDKSQRVRRRVMQDFDEAFKKVDCILTLTTPRNFIGMEEKLGMMDRYYSDVFTVPASLAGLPAISIPSGLTKHGLPMSLQVVGKHYDEGEIFNVAAIIHKRTGDLLKHLHNLLDS